MDAYFNSVQELKDIQRKGLNLTRDKMKETASKIGIMGTSGFSTGAFLRSPWAISDAPDIQLTVFPRVIEPHIVRMKDKMKKVKGPSMLVTVALLEPEARYEVFSNTEYSDGQFMRKPTKITPFEKHGFGMPSIRLPPGKDEYLTQKDVEILAWGVEEVRRIMTFPPLSRETGIELTPGPNVVGDTLKEHVRANHMVNSHWVGSTKMGSLENDPLAVVDERLRVRGTNRLRVVDASVIPNVPNGNTHSTVCVVASRAVDFILEDH